MYAEFESVPLRRRGFDGGVTADRSITGAALFDYGRGSVWVDAVTGGDSRWAFAMPASITR